MCRYRQRRFSASESSRVLLEVRKTSGIWVARTVPELGDRHLVLGEDLEQQGLGLELHPVDLVDQEDHRLGRADGLEQRPGQEELLGEDVLFELLPGLAGVGLDAQQLLLVVPLVEGLGLVQPLVALEADEPAPGQAGHRLGQLGLAGAGRALHQHRLGQPVGQEDHAGDPVVGQVLHAGQAVCARASMESKRGAPATGKPEVMPSDRLDGPDGAAPAAGPLMTAPARCRTPRT